MKNIVFSEYPRADGSFIGENERIGRASENNTNVGGKVKGTSKRIGKFDRLTGRPKRGLDYRPAVFSIVDANTNFRVPRVYYYQASRKFPTDSQSSRDARVFQLPEKGHAMHFVFWFIVRAGRDTLGIFASSRFRWFATAACDLRQSLTVADSRDSRQ